VLVTSSFIIKSKHWRKHGGPKNDISGFIPQNPLVVGASPFSHHLDLVKQLEDNGVSALVMYSLFEEEINHESLALDYFLNKGTESQPEAQTYLVEPAEIHSVADRYLAQLQRIKETVEIPVIASLNGTTTGGWVKLAEQIQAAGADALELNIYSLVTDPQLTSEQIEKSYLNLIQEVCKHVSIPVTVKLSPYLTSLPHFCLEHIKWVQMGLSYLTALCSLILISNLLILCEKHP